MVQAKKFENDTHKLYVEIAEGIKQVDTTNFSKIYELLPDIPQFEENKNIIGRILLSQLKCVSPHVSYYHSQEINFCTDPKSFSMRGLIPGSEIARSLELNKEAMGIVIDLYGNYSVSLRMLKFLLYRNYSLVKKINVLNQQHLDDLDRINELNKAKETNKIEPNIFLPGKLDVLTLTDEEKNNVETTVENPYNEEIKPVVFEEKKIDVVEEKEPVQKEAEKEEEEDDSVSDLFQEVLPDKEDDEEVILKTPKKKRWTK